MTKLSSRLAAVLLAFCAAITAWADVPFVATTVVDGQFAAGTHWYTMQINSNQFYITNNAGADCITLTGHATTRLADGDLWCFVGNDADGYRIYNKQTGTAKVLASSTTMSKLGNYGGTGGSTYPTLQDVAALPDGYADIWDFSASSSIASLTNGQYVTLRAAGAALNDFANLGKLAFWAEGTGVGSTIGITFAEASLAIDLEAGALAAPTSWSTEALADLTLTTADGSMTPDAETPAFIALRPGTYTLAAPSRQVVSALSANAFALEGTATLAIGGETFDITEAGTPIALTELADSALVLTIGSDDSTLVALRQWRATLKRYIAPEEESFEVFTSLSGQVPYRIPAIAEANNGDLIAIADYRYSGGDIGSGALDLRYRISHDGGTTWEPYQTLVSNTYNGGGFLHTGYGDPVIVADRESSRVLAISCSGNVMFPRATRTNHQGVARYYSDDNGATWSNPVDISESIYSQLDASTSGAAISLFVGSGKISQSRHIKVGQYYRIYCAILMRDVSGTYKNQALFSDDFGETWKVLGGVDVVPITGGDEPKADELPDGSVVLSSRTTGGRIYNIFTYTDAQAAEGYWGAQATSNASTSGVVATGNSCNGEILTVPVRRVSDGKQLFLFLQSIPFGSGRNNVGIYYKALESLADFISPAELAKNWDGRHQASTLPSAYSTMVLKKNGHIAFLFEENRYSREFCIVFKDYDIETITDGLFTFDNTLDVDSFIAAGISAREAVTATYVGTAVGQIDQNDEDSVDAIEDALADYKNHPSYDRYVAYNAAVSGAKRVELRSDVKYRLRNKLYPRLYLAVSSSQTASTTYSSSGTTQLLSFYPSAEEGAWNICNDAYGTYVAVTGANETRVPVVSTAADAGSYLVVSTLTGESYLRCTAPTGANVALHLATDQTRIVPWTTGADGSRWYIIPTDIATAIETVSVDKAAAVAATERLYDLNGRAVTRIARPGIYVTSERRKIIVK